MLKAEWFSAAATVCAAPDTSISRVWNAGGHGDPASDQERRPPAQRLAEARGVGHADDVGDAQAQDDATHGLGAAAWVHQRRRDQRGDTEIGAVGQPRHEPRQQHGSVARRQRAGDVAKREEAHQGDEQAPSRYPRRGTVIAGAPTTTPSA